MLSLNFNKFVPILLTASTLGLWFLYLVLVVFNRGDVKIPHNGMTTFFSDFLLVSDFNLKKKLLMSLYTDLLPCLC